MLSIECSWLYFLNSFFEMIIFREKFVRKKVGRELRYFKRDAFVDCIDVFIEGSLVVVSVHICDCLHCNDTSCAQAVQTFIPDYAMHEYQARL